MYKSRRYLRRLLSFLQAYLYGAGAAVRLRALCVSQNAVDLGQPAPHGLLEHGFPIFRSITLVVDNANAFDLVCQARHQKPIQSLACLLQRAAMQIQAGFYWPRAAFQILDQVGAVACTQVAGIIAIGFGRVEMIGCLRQAYEVLADGACPPLAQYVARSRRGGRQQGAAGVLDRRDRIERLPRQMWYFLN